MLIVRFLRWIFGYSEICVNGRFPERFLNLASRNGIILWDLRSEKENLFASIKRKETKTALIFAKKTECQLIIVKEHGLPYFCLKYRHRSGLLIGAILSSALCCFISCCIWNIDIHAPAGINEYEIRQELAQLGFHEGIIYCHDQVRDIETKLSMNDKRISWVSINVAGTNASVELSAGIPAVQRENNNEKTVSNLKSTADGTVTRISVRKGSSIVKTGEGVHKGQLLVSGIAELPDGSSRFYDSDGEIYASTYRILELSVPKNIEKTIIDDNYSEKLNITFFGITIPAVFNGSPYDKRIIRTEKYRSNILDQDIPLKSQRELFFSYEETKYNYNKTEAEKLLRNRFQLYKLFVTGSSDTRILSENIRLIEDSNSYRLRIQLTTEENICEKSYISVKEIS